MEKQNDFTNKKETFLINTKKLIDDGAYDEYLNLPFMSKDLFWKAINARLKRRNVYSLTDSEIKNVIEETKETAGTTFYLFLKYGFLEKTEEGYTISRKGTIALKEASKF